MDRVIMCFHLFVKVFHVCQLEVMNFQNERTTMYIFRMREFVRKFQDITENEIMEFINSSRGTTSDKNFAAIKLKSGILFFIRNIFCEKRWEINWILSQLYQKWKKILLQCYVKVKKLVFPISECFSLEIREKKTKILILFLLFFHQPVEFVQTSNWHF